MSKSLEDEIRPEIWEMIKNAVQVDEDQPPAEALELLEQRSASVKTSQSQTACEIRSLHSGWVVQDGKKGAKAGKTLVYG